MWQGTLLGCVAGGETQVATRTVRQCHMDTKRDCRSGLTDSLALLSWQTHAPIGRARGSPASPWDYERHIYTLYIRQPWLRERQHNNTPVDPHNARARILQGWPPVLLSFSVTICDHRCSARPAVWAQDHSNHNHSLHTVWSSCVPSSTHRSQGSSICFYSRL